VVLVHEHISGACGKYSWMLVGEYQSIEGEQHAGIVSQIPYSKCEADNIHTSCLRMLMSTVLGRSSCHNDQSSGVYVVRLNVNITGEHQVIEGEHIEQYPKFPMACPNYIVNLVVLVTRDNLEEST